MDPRAGLDRCGKSRLPPGFDPWTVQPVASRYITELPCTACTGLKMHCFQCLLGFVVTLNLVVIVFK